MDLLILFQFGMGALVVFGVLALVAATRPEAKGDARWWLVTFGAFALFMVAYIFSPLSR